MTLGQKLKEIISQIPKSTAYSFSMSMVVFIVIGLIAGVEAMSMSMLIQILIVCVVAAILQKNNILKLNIILYFEKNIGYE